MSDCSPLKLAENGNSSPSQSISENSQPQNDNLNQNASMKDDSREVEFRYHQHNEAGDNRGARTRTQSECSTKSGQLRYGAKNVIELFIPVSICMLIVVGTMKATDSYHYSGQSVIWYAQMMFTDENVDTGTRVWQSFANALIMLVFIVIMTTVLIMLYKFRCYAVIHGWLILSSLMLLFFFTVMYIAELLKVYNIPLDNYTLMIFIWNFGVVGMISIHWKGPLMLQQAYLITISALMALVFIRCLPDWTIWTVLGIVSVWDLVAVLCPRGPLRILVETAQERNEPIFPALIYSSTVMWEVGSGILSTAIVSTVPALSMADRGNDNQKKSRNKRNRAAHSKGEGSSTSRRDNRGANVPPSPTKRNHHPVEIDYEDKAQPPRVAIIQPTISGTSTTSEDWHRPQVRALSNSYTDSADHRTIGEVEAGREVSVSHPGTNMNHSQSSHQQVEEERGVKLGLGDFIFFSVLVGKASSYGDWTITMSCYVAILVGLCLTLSLLAVFRKALPALPISIAFGLGSFFLSYLFVVPFAEKLAINQVFI